MPFPYTFAFTFDVISIGVAGLGLKTLFETTIQANDAAYARIIYAPNELPDDIKVLPAIVILLGESNPVTFGTDVDVVFRVIILMGTVDNPSCANKLIDYVNQTGDYSVYAAVASDRTLNGSAESAEVLRNLGLGSTRWGRQEYISTEFEVKAYV